MPTIRRTIDVMTAQLDYWPEPDSTTVARRLRMHLGDKKISRNRLAAASGISRTSLANKLDGLVDFTISEVIDIAHALETSWVWVLTGVELAHPRVGDGQTSDPSPAPKAPRQTPKRTPSSGLRIKSHCNGSIATVTAAQRSHNGQLPNPRPHSYHRSRSCLDLLIY